MGALQPLEKPLEQLNDKLPKLPKNVKNSIAQFAAWLAVAGAALMAWIVYKRWDNISDINKAKDSIGEYASYMSSSYSSELNDFTTKLWILLAIAAVAAVLFGLAFTKLQSFAKQGWDLALMGILVSIVYAIVFLFIFKDADFGDVFLHLVVALAGLYAALQVKDYFTGKEKVVIAPKAPTPPPTTPQV